MAINENINLPVKAPGATRVAGQFAAVSTSIKSASLSLKTLAAGLVAGFGFKQAIDIIEGFEKEMAAVRAISGATEEQFQQLSATARELGATTIFSARQAAEGLTELSKLGFTAEESMDALSSTLTLAQAGQLSLGEASAITGAAVRSFGVDAKRSSDIADVFAKASQSSALTVSGLGQAMSFLGATAASMGVSLQEASAAVGVVADSGVKASRAGRGLATLFSELAKETEKVNTQAQKYGLTARDLNPIYNDFTVVMRNLAQVFGEAGTAQKTFGVINARTATLLVRGSKRFGELLDQLNNSKGAAQEFARILGDTLFGAFKSLRSAVEESIQQIGDAGLRKATVNATQALSGMLNVLNGTAEAFIQNTNLTNQQIQVFVKLAGALKIVLGSLKAIVQSIALLSKALAAGASSIVDFNNLIAESIRAVATRDFSRLTDKFNILKDGVIRGFRDINEERKKITGLGDVIEGTDLLLGGDIYDTTIKNFKRIKVDADAAGSAVDKLNARIGAKVQGGAGEGISNVIDLSQVREAESLRQEFNSLSYEAEQFIKNLDELRGNKFASQLKSEFDKLSGAAQNVSQSFQNARTTGNEYFELLRSGVATDEQLEESSHRYRLALEQLSQSKRIYGDVVKEVEGKVRDLEKAERDQANEAKKNARERIRAEKEVQRAAEEAVKQRIELAKQLVKTLGDVVTSLQNITRAREQGQLSVESATARVGQVEERQEFLQAQREAIQDQLDRGGLSDELTEELKRELRQISEKELQTFHDLENAQYDVAKTELQALHDLRQANTEGFFKVIDSIIELGTQLYSAFKGGQASNAAASNAAASNAGGLPYNAGGGIDFSGIYHRGGVVGGPSGQNVPILAKSGEVILTPNQFDNIMSQNRKSSGKTNVNIIDQRSNQEPLPEVSQDEYGNMQILIRNSIGESISDGSYDSAFRTRYGLEVRGV